MANWAWKIKFLTGDAGKIPGAIVLIEGYDSVNKECTVTFIHDNVLQDGWPDSSEVEMTWDPNNKTGTCTVNLEPGTRFVNGTLGPFRQASITFAPPPLGLYCMGSVTGTLLDPPATGGLGGDPVDFMADASVVTVDARAATT